MRKISFLLLLVVVFISGCSPQTTRLSELPLEKGTTWIYSSEAYEPSTADPNQIIKAIYQLTETVVETKTVSTYFVAHVKRERELVNADVAWTGDFAGEPVEYWYVVKGNQVFRSNQLRDEAALSLDELILEYEFPLSVKKSWCGLPNDRKDPKGVAGCDLIGRRAVIDQGPYETPAGNFDDCYDMVDYYNGGNIFLKFCTGIGIVHMKFDHAGTRFGFEQTLIQYSAGAP